MPPASEHPSPAPFVSSRALREFVNTEVAGAVALIAAAVVAVVWANSPWQDGYHRLWSTELVVSLGQWHLDLSLREWVNEGLMTIFFLVVGFEIKREFIQGELADRRRAVLPVVAAVGGMVVPALLYIAINAGGIGTDGWGIPMATDIAFALGVLALVAPGVPGALRVFLLTLAIVDDIGAIIVIALFYSGPVNIAWIFGAVLLLIAGYLGHRLGLAFPPAYLGVGIGVWLALYAAGISPTLAGVALGLLAPASPRLTHEIVASRHDELLDVSSPVAARTTSRIARHAVSQLEWLEHLLHPWSTWLIVPLFALANAGITLSAGAFREAAVSPVGLGVAVGLVAGKPIGIAGASWMACRLGWTQLPSGTSWSQLAGVAALGGIGFTVSLFISALAFDDQQLATEATVGIFVAAVAASLVAIVLFRRARHTPSNS